MTFVNPDLYYEDPGPDVGAMAEETEQDVDNLVAEWASLAEVETFAQVHVSRGGDVEIELQQVQHDGEILYAHEPSKYGLWFATVEDFRAHMEANYPFIQDV